MILGRVHHKSIRLTPCGRHRKDVIYDVSENEDIGKFISEACRIVKEFQRGISDVIALEHFRGKKGQETRRDGESLFTIKKEDDWNFYKGDEHIFSFEDEDNLMQKAIELKKAGGL